MFSAPPVWVLGFKKTNKQKTYVVILTLFRLIFIAISIRFNDILILFIKNLLPWIRN